MEMVREQLEKLIRFNLTEPSPSGNYDVSIAAKYFHRIPHIDIRLNWVNSTFDPSDNEYLEALGIMVAIPGFWLIFTLLTFLIFFLCCCCDVNSKRKRKLTCCKCCLFLFTMITVTVIAVGFIGAYQSHLGMVKMEEATRNISHGLETMWSNPEIIEDTLETEINENLRTMKDKIVGPLVRNYTLMKYIQDQVDYLTKNVTRALQRAQDFADNMEVLDVALFPNTIDQVESIRWPATLGTLASLTFICIILMMGVCRHSRCLLILFSVLGLLSLVVCWVLTSVYLGLAVAGSDYCMDPDSVLDKKFSGEHYDNFIKNYLRCNPSFQNPFRKLIDFMDEMMSGHRIPLAKVKEACSGVCRDRDVTNAIREVTLSYTKITSLINTVDDWSECSRVHKSYLSSLNAVCRDLLEGVGLMLASAAGTGLILTLLVFCASHTWINIRKKRPAPVESTDETDPFLPPPSASSTVSSANSKRVGRGDFGTGSSGRPRFSHTPPQTPHYPGAGSLPGSGAGSHSTPADPRSGLINGRSALIHSNRDDQLTFISAPPSYEQVGGGQGPGGHSIVGGGGGHPMAPNLNPHLPPSVAPSHHHHHTHHPPAVGQHYVVSYRK